MSATKIYDKIRKLLAQAHDQEGTAEGEAFQAKAFDLLARYGLTEFDVTDTSADLAEEVVEQVTVPKTYRVQRQGLLAAIGEAFGVAVGRFTGSHSSVLAGTRRNVERTKLLFEQLSLHVESGAATVRGDGTFTATQMRKSYWVGYSLRVNERLHEVEKSVHEELRKTGAALVPVDELDKAQKLLQSHYRSRADEGTTYNKVGAGLGAARANEADLGRARVQGRRELATGL